VTASLALELLGYAASALIAISLMMRSVVRLRLINLAGAATFSLYGFLIGAYPVGILNMLTASINVYQLYRLRKRREFFRILEVNPETSQYLTYFLEFQKNDIARFVPGFCFDPRATSVALFVLRDLVPAGLLLGTIRDGRMEVHLDYAVPQYRDLRIARHLFLDRADFFHGKGVREIVSPGGAEEHCRYLRRMGFVPEEDGETYKLALR
jgi:hypothetical protein